MRLFTMLSWVTVPLGAWAIVPFGFFQQSGHTKLLGTSFGILGQNAAYDYVIVGGGTSGLTVAKRLSENPSISIAIVEAGNFYEYNNGNISQIPAFFTMNLNAEPDPANVQPLIDWGFMTQPSPQINGRRMHYSQGKCLGGSTGRNGNVYHRGTVGTYQKWAEMIGDSSFTWDNLLPYFKKSMSFTPPNLQKLGPNVNVPFDPTVFSPSGGPLHVSYSNYYQPISPYSIKAFESLGLHSIDGFNSGELIGWSHITTTIDPRAETRDSAETSFLQSAIQGPTKLQIYKQTLAKKIIFNSQKRAIGVQVTTDGITYTLSAAKEVIVATGVFHSPQLLMVSGIGPEATLKQFGIPVISNLQGVGQNLWDQPGFTLAYQVNVSTHSSFGNPAYLEAAIQQYLNEQSGPLSNPGGDIFGFEKLPQPYRAALDPNTLADLASFPDDWPELEIIPSAFGPPDNTTNVSALLIAILTPLSRGNVTIASTNTDDLPLVSPNYLSSPTDQKLIVQAFKRAREIAKALSITRGAELSGSDSLQTDAEILEFIKNTTTPFYHGAGTCAMGKGNDSNAVVDNHGKVYGVSGLRIVDASAFPFSPPGHTMSNVYMLAEKLADDIKKGSGRSRIRRLF